MIKFWKILQYGYLLIALICLVEGVIRFNSDRSKSYFFFGFAIFITIIFFIKRKLRRKIEQRNNSNQPK